MPDISFARRGRMSSSFSAPPLLRPEVGPSAVHPPAGSHIEGERRLMNTTVSRKPDKDVLEVVLQ
jgi:hypothetical protein